MLDPGQRGLDRCLLACVTVAIAAFAIGALVGCHHPLAPVRALFVFLLWCAAVAWRPGIWLFVVPACLPLLNFGPWTGWVVLEEFDLLIWGVAAGGYARVALARWTPPEAPELARSDRVFACVAAVLGIFGAVAFVRGLSMAAHDASGWF